MSTESTGAEREGAGLEGVEREGAAGGAAAVLEEARAANRLKHIWQRRLRELYSKCDMAYEADAESAKDAESAEREELASGKLLQEILGAAAALYRVTLRAAYCTSRADDLIDRVADMDLRVVLRLYLLDVGDGRPALEQLVRYELCGSMEMARAQYAAALETLAAACDS